MDNFDELKGNVAQALEAKGVLSSIRAQLRAAVFNAINEEDSKSDEHPGLSSLKQLHADDSGLTMLALVQDFLGFYNLQYSLNVLNSEASFGDEMASPDRAALVRQLQLQHDNPQQPLLASILSNMSRDVSASPIALPRPDPAGEMPAALASVSDTPTDGAASPAASSPGAGLSSPSPLKQNGAPVGGALHHSPSSQQLLGASPSPQQEATDDDLAAALSAALQEEETPPTAAQQPAFGLSALPSLSLGSPGSLEGLRDRLPAGEGDEGGGAAPRGGCPAGTYGAKLDVSDSFEDTLGSSSGKQGGPVAATGGGVASDSDEGYGDDEDWEEEELPDEVSDDGSASEGQGSAEDEEERVLSTAVPIAQLAALSPSTSPGRQSAGGGSEDEFALSMGDSRSMGDSGALDAAPVQSAAGAVDDSAAAADAGPLDASWTEEGRGALHEYDVQEAVQK